MKKISTFLLLMISVKNFAQNYPVSAISAEMKENAHAVVRNHETEFFVKNMGEGTMKVTAAVTILDEKGDEHTNLYLTYDKFTKINNLEAVIYNEAGKQVKKLKRADIENYGGSGDNLATDNFIRVAKLSYNVYPYTIAFSYEYTTKNMMAYPTWEAIADNAENTSVEKSSFLVSMPVGLELRFKEQKMPSPATIYGDAERKIYAWKVQNLKAIEQEPASPDANSMMPMVFTAPTDFKIDDYVGKINSWEDLAKFYGFLNQDRDKLPTELVQKLKELVKNELDRVKKIKKIYEYLQANTRYVSIQLGIGGWQTIKAEEVASKGYGDCKALTNFTKGMLKEMGIAAYPALVRAGENKADIRADFPSFQFNHVILCVPNQKDTLWLECTSQSQPVGYLGSFTSDRHVVLIQENGGKLIMTPTYKSTDNQQVRHAVIQLKEDGEAEAQVTTTYSGLQQDEPAAVINELGKDDQKKWFYKTLNLPSVEINDFSMVEKREKIPSVIEKMSLHLRNIANKSGSRIFLTPNLMNQSKSVPLANANRKNDFELPMNFIDTDSITFQIPKNYAAEYLPEPMKFQSKFGSYSSSISMIGDKINYVRQVMMKKGQFPPSQYAEWVEFKKKIVKADKNQVVLVSK